MKIMKTTVTKLRLTGLENLDPVSVFLEDFWVGAGQLTIECFGRSWSATWPAMGERSISEFVASASTEYIANSMFSGPRKEPDYDRIAEAIGYDSIDYEGVLRHEDVVAEAFGPDWRMNLPEKETADWLYLCRIVDAVRIAARDCQQEAA